MSRAAPRLEVRGLTKSFGRTQALRGVSFSVEPGELLVIAGENGAGKSTLIRILSGVFGEYGGEVRLDGAPVRLRTPADAARAQVATLHQELSLLGNLSVADNFLLAEGGAAFSGIDRAGVGERTARALAELELAIAPETPVEALSLAERQLVEIARALSRRARVLILDEPTSALSASEAERLFQRLEAVRRAGTSVLYISHRMEELYRLADRIVVLRDGRSVLDGTPAELTPERVVVALLGREPAAVSGAAARRDGPPLLRVQGLCAPPLEQATFELRPGELLGLAGLGDSGVRQVLLSVFGAVSRTAGSLELGGAVYAPDSPRAALGSGVSLVPGDRALGVFPALDGVTNATLSSLARYVRYGFVDRARERVDARAQAERSALRPESLEQPAETLSGGNQQKLVVMRSLLVQPRLLLLDDPSRGIDIGAKLDLHRTLRAIASDGVGVIFFSSELDELGSVCDRVLGFCRGRLALELERGSFDRTRLLSALMGAAA